MERQVPRPKARPRIAPEVRKKAKQFDIEINAPKSKEQMALAKRRHDVAFDYLEGVDQMTMAVKYGVSQNTIHADLQYVRQIWTIEAGLPFAELKQKELARIDKLEHECWEGWRRSLEDGQEESVETYKQKARSRREPEEQKGKFTSKVKGEKASVEVAEALVAISEKVSRKVAKKAGNPQFLAQIAWCIETRLKLMGAYKDINVNVGAMFLNWDEVAKSTPKDTGDIIEAKIQGVLEGKE